MRVPSGSVFFAALASSTSVVTLVGAAPADSSAPAAVPASGSNTPAAPSVPALPLGVPNLPGLPVPSRREHVEARQLDALLGLVGGLNPIVQQVLVVLGLLHNSSLSASAESADGPPLPADLAAKITELVKNKTSGLPIPLPVPLPAGPLDGKNDSSPDANSSAIENLFARSKAEWANEQKQGGPDDGLTMIMDASHLATRELPVSPPAPPASPPAGLPISVPNCSIIPGTPAGASAPPASLPVSPPLPANPPNTPMAAEDVSQPALPPLPPLPLVGGSTQSG